MRIVSWNVNGLRAVSRKGFHDWLEEARPDVLALQEVKAREDQLDALQRAPAGYHGFFHPAERAGYSGVATFSRDPIPEDRVSPGFGIERYDREGRVLITRHPGFVLYNVYFPNGKKDEERLRYKLDFYDDLLEHANARVAAGEHVVVCGDWNTAHRAIDLARPEANRKTSGFMPIECAAMDRWTEAGWVDAFRHLHPDARDAYSWWSMRSGARERNVGWRIDYHFVSPGLAGKIAAAEIWRDVTGSDHCPVLLALEG